MNSSLLCSFVFLFSLFYRIGGCHATNASSDNNFVQLDASKLPEEIKLYTLDAQSSFKENDTDQFTVLQSKLNPDIFVYSFKPAVKFQEIKYNDTVLWVNGDYNISEPISMIYKVDTRITIRDIVKSINYRLLTGDDSEDSQKPGSQDSSSEAPNHADHFRNFKATEDTAASVPKKVTPPDSRFPLTTFIFSFQLFMAILLVAVTTLLFRLYGLVYQMKLTVDKSDQRSLLA